MPDTEIDVKTVPAVREPATDLWHSFRSEVDRLFERFDGGFKLPSMARIFDTTPTIQTSFEFSVPAVDVNEDDKAYKITAELPGLDEKHIEVSLFGDRLILKGEKRQERKEKDKDHFLSERAYGSFQRSFRLPEGVDVENISATMAKGVLEIILPKTAEAQKQQKKIQVKAA
ncbi:MULTISPECIES: Hsp20/alpha crystallin family protein [Nitrospirillum]|uniref:Heat shock protein Hsp20 n=1 Tax=Nitrospirillum amazonense TaxID=28077 RepID=A0A560FNJ7_9PROT|nr:Hsp20/alpha crystallin family protein [Nitrospirillum amazonense]MEC4593843.1 Hsp20/alpha crystallin family protein [Nitrospirillum amazonense]TWB23179.1 heat shock protein Hsp20 [Nitrospirillum amazonense]